MALRDWEDTGGGGVIDDYRPSERSRPEDRWYLVIFEFSLVNHLKS